MTDSINRIYGEIKEKLTLEHLKNITIEIIDSYKRKDYRRLRKFVSILKLNREVGDAKLFSLLIRQYHPDRFHSIHTYAKEIFENGDFEKLKSLHGIYFFNKEITSNTPEETEEYEATYSYSEDDFGYKEMDFPDDNDFGESALDFDDEEFGFMDAIHKLFFGGLDYTITESDLKNLDGGLDLSDYEMSDLNGIEHCVHLTELNLSGNAIRKIGKLKTLVNIKNLYLANNSIETIEPLEKMIYLKELDISFNAVADIAGLENFPELEYVNIIGNPIKDYRVVNRLAAKGVVVISDQCKESILLINFSES